MGYTAFVPNTERHSDNRTRRPPAPRARARRAGTDGGHRAANRLVDILELLAASRDGLALREVSRHLRAPKSSLLPLLRALTARGYLAQGRALEYRLRPGALDLRAAAPAHPDLIAGARPAVVDPMRRAGGA